MTIRIFKTFILLLIVGMIIPIYLYNDNVLKDQAVTQKDYSFCEQVNYKFLYFQCVAKVQQQKAVSCQNFPEGEVRESCLQSTIQQKDTVMQIAQMRNKYTWLNYRPIASSIIAVILFLFLIKGKWINKFPRYRRALEQVTDVLPESDYFARQSFLIMSSVIVAMGIGMIIIFEILALLYK